MNKLYSTPESVFLLLRHQILYFIFQYIANFRSVNMSDTRFRHNFTCLVSGPTGAGKSIWVKKFLKYIDQMVDVTFDRILFYYGEWQDGYKNDIEKNIEFREGIPSPDDYSHDPEKKKLVIIDDLMREATNNIIVDLFTKGSHHKNISVIFITQNIFYKGQRDISLNTNYIVLFKNPRDRAQITHLARQIFPEDPRFLQQAFIDSTKKPHSYLLIDLKQSTPDELRIRTCIFPDDEHQIVYLPKHSNTQYSGVF